MNAWRKHASTLAHLLVMPLLTLTVAAPVLASGTIQQPAKAQPQAVQSVVSTTQPILLTEEEMERARGEGMSWSAVLELARLGYNAWGECVIPYLWHLRHGHEGVCHFHWDQLIWGRPFDYHHP